MNPLINVLIILSVSILLGILIIPRLKKGKYRMEGGVMIDPKTLAKLVANQKSTSLSSTQIHSHTHVHDTKNIVIVIAMSILMVGGLLALVWQQQVQVEQTHIEAHKDALLQTLKDAQQAVVDAKQAVEDEIQAQKDTYKDCRSDCDGLNPGTNMTYIKSTKSMFSVHPSPFWDIKARNNAVSYYSDDTGVHKKILGGLYTDEEMDRFGFSKVEGCSMRTAGSGPSTGTGAGHFYGLYTTIPACVPYNNDPNSRDGWSLDQKQKIKSLNAEITKAEQHLDTVQTQMHVYAIDKQNPE